MADFDAQQPVRAIATQFTTEVANAAGTTINPAEDYAQGSTTSGQNGVLLQGAVTTGVPTYTTGTTNPLSLDINGNLRVSIDSSASEQSVNLNQVGGSAISIGQATMAASLPVVLASNQSAIPVTLTSTTITGTVAVTQSTSPWVVSGTVTSNIGTTGGLALDTTVAKLTLAQGSTTTGQTGSLGLTATTTAAPTYVTGTSNPFSTDTAGNLRVTLAASSAEQNVNLNQLNGVALGSPSNYGTTPGAVSVQGVNAFVTNTVATTLASTTITGTVAVTQSTSPWVVSLASTTITGTVTVAGNLTHNNAAPAANNIGVLPAVASTAAPTYTTGDQVLLSTDLAGNLRTTATISTPAVVLTYFTDATVATNATVTHSLAGPVTLDEVWASGSGEIKVVIAIGTTGSEVTYVSGFTSASNQNFNFSMKNGYVIPTGSSAKITITNRDTQSQSTYLTFVSH